MFTVTRPACAYLADRLASANAPDGIIMRLVLQGEALDVRPDHGRAGDLTFAHDGQLVLALDAETAQALEDYSLGLQETPHGARLHLRES